MVHFGHANIIRQAKLLGDYLIVGVHSDGMYLSLHQISFLVDTPQIYLYLAFGIWQPEFFIHGIINSLIEHFLICLFRGS